MRVNAYNQDGDGTLSDAVFAALPSVQGSKRSTTVFTRRGVTSPPAAATAEEVSDGERNSLTVPLLISAGLSIVLICVTVAGVVVMVRKSNGAAKPGRTAHKQPPPPAAQGKQPPVGVVVVAGAATNGRANGSIASRIRDELALPTPLATTINGSVDMISSTLTPAAVRDPSDRNGHRLYDSAETTAPEHPAVFDSTHQHQTLPYSGRAMSQHHSAVQASTDTTLDRNLGPSCSSRSATPDTRLSTHAPGSADFNQTGNGVPPQVADSTGDPHNNQVASGLRVVSMYDDRTPTSEQSLSDLESAIVKRADSHSFPMVNGGGLEHPHHHHASHGELHQRSDIHITDAHLQHLVAFPSASISDFSGLTGGDLSQEPTPLKHTARPEQAADPDAQQHADTTSVEGAAGQTSSPDDYGAAESHDPNVPTAGCASLPDEGIGLTLDRAGIANRPTSIRYTPRPQSVASIRDIPVETGEVCC